MECTNWPAETELRYAVINRKTCGSGNRTKRKELPIKSYRKSRPKSGGSSAGPRQAPARLFLNVSPAGQHEYSIRDARTSEAVMSETFTNLMLALDMGQALANVRRARLEIVRADGSFVVAMDPKAWLKRGNETRRLFDGSFYGTPFSSPVESGHFNSMSCNDFRAEIGLNLSLETENAVRVADRMGSH